MKRIIGLIAAIMLFVAPMAYAGGDQNCGDKASGSAGSTGGGAVTQNRPPAN